MPRTILVGDVHGCRAELEALLTRTKFAAGDRLVMTGDLVVRGPDPAGTLELLIALRARSVRGNHDDRMARCHHGEAPVGDAQLAVLRALSGHHWAYLEALPLWLDLPEHGVRVVHAGVVPGVPIERQSPRSLMYMRGLGPRNEPIEKRSGSPWGARYHEAPHVVFGHNALPDPQIHPHATGLDTGCVYGGKLTALVLDEGEPPPRRKNRAKALTSVAARRAYAED